MKKRLARIIVSGLLFAAAAIIRWRFEDTSGYFGPALSIIAYLLIGYDVLFSAGRNIVRGQIFDENFLMCIATVGAFALGDFLEAAAVMLFYQVGELFQDYAVDRSRKSISGLMDIRPDFANIRKDGELLRVDPYDVSIGDIIVIKPGERVPLDAVVTVGSSSLDTSALTGESVPRDIQPGDEVLSGCINMNGLVEAKVIREFGESTASRILDMVENASAKKSVAERFITRFARYYTPAVVVAAALLALLPPLILRQPFMDWVPRALIFLVVSCPCALVISIPLSFFGGIGGASRRGILVKGSNYLDALAKAETIVFDKTGTLTRGVFEVGDVKPCGGDREELLRVAAYAESYSNHPISQSLRRAFGQEIDQSKVTDFTDIPGYGISATVDGQPVLAGNARLMQKNSLVPDESAFGTVVHVAAGGRYMGWISITDMVKPDAADAIRRLEGSGVKQTVMLTGDADAPGQEVAARLGISKAFTQLLPQDKVQRVEDLLAQKRTKSTLVFVGDGINDAPVLARADVGIAMGALGSDAAIEAADIVIMDDKPSKVATAIGIARRTTSIAGQNIVFALGVKVLVLGLAAAGKSGMWQAIFADVGVSVIAILNSLRALNTKRL